MRKSAGARSASSSARESSTRILFVRHPTATLATYGAPLEPRQGGADLVARHGAAHEGEGVARVHEDGTPRGVCVAHDEPAGSELPEDAAEVGVGGGAPRVVAEPFDDARAIGIGLQASERPEARVGERAIVEVHRVLRGGTSVVSFVPSFLLLLDGESQ